MPIAEFFARYAALNAIEVWRHGEDEKTKLRREHEANLVKLDKPMLEGFPIDPLAEESE